MTPLSRPSSSRAWKRLARTFDQGPDGDWLVFASTQCLLRVWLAVFLALFEGESVWLTQAPRSELFQTTPQNITQHIRKIYAAGELDDAGNL